MTAYRNLIATALLCVAAVAAGGQPSPDTIRIISVTPVDSVTRGVPVMFRIEVETALHSRDSALVYVGFNIHVPDSWSMRDTKQMVHRGQQRLSLGVRTVPVDWRGAGHFTVQVMIGKDRVPGRSWTELAGDRRAIPVRH